MNPVILNLTAEVEEQFHVDGMLLFVVVKVNGVEIARNDGQDYVDTWGDGGNSVADVAAELLRSLLGGNR